MNVWINAISFQIGWWACAFSVSLGWDLQATALCLVLFGMHLKLSRAPRQEMTLAVAAWCLGVLTDTALQYFSIIHFNGWAWGEWSPFWLWSLWVLFATTLNASLGFLKQQTMLTLAVLGCVFGPLSYYAGARLGAAQLDISLPALGVLALAWMVDLVLLVNAARRLSLP